MSRSRLLLSLDPAVHEHLVREASRERLLPAELAKRAVSEWLAQRSTSVGKSPDSNSVSLLLRWLDPHVDAVYESGGWARDIAVSFFEQIEKYAADLYLAAEQELGRKALNQIIGRRIRLRLRACVVELNGRARVMRVPATRTTLVKSVTLLRPG